METIETKFKAGDIVWTPMHNQIMCVYAGPGELFLYGDNLEVMLTVAQDRVVCDFWVKKQLQRGEYRIEDVYMAVEQEEGKYARI